jgi:hypothetical protein
VVLQEPPPTLQKSKVVAMFINDEEKPSATLRKGVRLGSLAGQGYDIPEDFNDPSDDLKEYM